MLDGRVLEASQVEYNPFGKPPLQREIHGSATMRIFWTETPYDQIVFSCNTTSCEQLYNQVPADTSRGYEMSHT